MPTERDIHTATVIRLQVAHNALEVVTPVLSDTAMDLPAIARHLEQHNAEGMAADLRDMQTKLNEALALARAALDIARGARTDVPPQLRGSLAPDPAMIARFLEIPAGQ